MVPQIDLTTKLLLKKRFLEFTLEILVFRAVRRGEIDYRNLSPSLTSLPLCGLALSWPLAGPGGQMLPSGKSGAPFIAI